MGAATVAVTDLKGNLLYGRNAEAGVLSIHTRQPGDTPYVRLEAGTGSRDLRTMSVDASTATSRAITP